MEKVFSIILLFYMLFYFALIVISGVITNRKFKGKHITEDERLRIYRMSEVNTWLFMAIFLGMALLAGYRVDTDLGLGFHFGQYDINFIFVIAVIVVAFAFMVVMIRRMIRFSKNPQVQIKAWIKITTDGGKDSELKNTGENLILPRTPREKKAFLLVSISAGICEEITMRGVLFVVLEYVLPTFPLIWLPLIAGILFGFAHSYQGPTGILKVGLIGILLGYLYLATGSLFPGMLLHFIVDISNRFVYPDRFNEVQNCETD